MGYAVYDDLNGLDRMSGYGVPAYCDFAGCDAEIDRGMGYRCESGTGYVWDPKTEDEIEVELEGCGYQFCTEHSDHADHDNVHWDGREHPKWMWHVLHDPTWGEWRAERPDKVAEFRKALKK